MTPNRARLAVASIIATFDASGMDAAVVRFLEEFDNAELSWRTKQALAEVQQEVNKGDDK